MRKFFILLATGFFAVSVYAQNIGIGTTTPDASAALDIKSTTKGLLIPALSFAQRNAIPAPATGLLVFQTDNTPGFYYYTGSGWSAIAGSGAAQSWNINGNSGSNPLTHFIGTTDLQPLRFRIQNVNAGIIDSAFNNTAIGFRSLDSISTGVHNTAFGVSSLIGNTEGNYNTGLGSFSLRLNKTGNYNTASGYVTLRSNTTGSFNTAMGSMALYSNTTGIGNAALGHKALYSNSTGNQNIAIGAESLLLNTVGSNNTGLGNYS